MGKVIRKKSEGISSFDTEDFGLAIALSIKGHEIIGMHPVGNCCSIVFHFAVTSGIEQQAQDYWEGKLQVDTHEYWHEYKNLTAYIYGVLYDED
jgi:hypothetical protein